MSLLQIIMAHKEAQATFDRHLPLWERNGKSIMVFCPIDSIVSTALPVIAYGRSSHHDAMANRRFQWLLKFLKDHTAADWYIIHEYDSFCACWDVPRFEAGKLWANAWENNDRRKFTESNFFHPPLMMDRGVLVAVADAVNRLPDTAQHGFWDRLLGLAVDQSSIPWSGYGPLGFSRNTIEPSDIPGAVSAKRAGAVLFHGVKTPQAMNAILDA